jgi:hypothetical protein
MVAFRRGVTITTDTPTVVVDPGLPVGVHRFELVVTDAAGNVSRPTQIAVSISGLTGPIGPVRPTAPPAPPISPIRPVTPVVNPPLAAPPRPRRRTRPDRSRS